MNLINKSIEFLSFLIVIILGLISKVLNRKSRTKFGRLIGRSLMISKKRKQITYNNIRNAFPDFSEIRIQEILIGSYENLGITMFELLAFHMFNIDDFRSYIKFENEYLLKQVRSRGKGMILLSGHFGNWEMLALAAGAFANIPITIVVKPQRNKFIDKLLNKQRTLMGNSVVPMSKAAKTMINSIKKNEAIALLADQSADADKDIFIDFFGRQAVTYEAPAALALRYEVPIIIGFAVRNENDTYNVELIEIKHDDLTNDKAGIAELTKRHVNLLEQEIKRNPHLWAWQHNRWKHKQTTNQN